MYAPDELLAFARDAEEAAWEAEQEQTEVIRPYFLPVRVPGLIEEEE